MIKEDKAGKNMGNFFGFAAELLEKGRAEVSEVYAAAELYDLVVHSKADAQFYVSLAQRQGGSVLDLACGSGRLLGPLLAAGLDVTGLDLSEDMIKQARHKLGSQSERLELIVGDMRTFELDKSFNTIIIPYCSLMYIQTDEEREALFERCYRHLKPGGYLAFDFPAGEVEVVEELPHLALQGIHPFTGEILISVVQIKGLNSELRLLNQINYVIPPGQKQAKITINSSTEAVLSAKKAAAHVKQVGFEIEGIYEDYTLKPYDGGEECLIIGRKAL